MLFSWSTKYMALNHLLGWIYISKTEKFNNSTGLEEMKRILKTVKAISFFLFFFFCRVWVKMSVLGNSSMTLCCSSWLVKTLCLVTLCSVLANPNLTHFTKLWTLRFGRLKNCFQVINWRLIRDSNLTSQRTEWFDNSTGGF